MSRSVGCDSSRPNTLPDDARSAGAECACPVTTIALTRPPHWRAKRVLEFLCHGQPVTIQPPDD
jgi:hypothetical protein